MKNQSKEIKIQEKRKAHGDSISPAIVIFLFSLSSFLCL